MLLRDDDHRGRRTAIEQGFAEAYAQGHTVPAVLALAVECIEAWALADSEAWRQVYGQVPTLPPRPEELWGDRRDPASNHPKCVLQRCFQEIGRASGGNAVARLIEHASLPRIASRCPRGFGRFVADLRRAFPPIACVVAASADRAVGLGGAPPWGFETLRDHANLLRGLLMAAGEDSRLAVVVGRKAWQALPALPRSPRRLDIVVSRNAACDVPAHVHLTASLDEALHRAVMEQVDRIYVLGGGELYRQTLGHFRCTDVHYTRVDAEFPGADTFFPEFETDAAWSCGASPTQHHDNGFDYRIEHWSRFTPGI